MWCPRWNSGMETGHSIKAKATWTKHDLFNNIVFVSIWWHMADVPRVRRPEQRKWSVGYIYTRIYKYICIDTDILLLQCFCKSKNILRMRCYFLKKLRCGYEENSKRIFQWLPRSSEIAHIETLQKYIITAQMIIHQVWVTAVLSILLLIWHVFDHILHITCKKMGHKETKFYSKA